MKTSGRLFFYKKKHLQSIYPVTAAGPSRICTVFRSLNHPFVFNFEDIPYRILAVVSSAGFNQSINVYFFYVKPRPAFSFFELLDFQSRARLFFNASSIFSIMVSDNTPGFGMIRRFLSIVLIRDKRTFI
jgi:hypothetical protein